jgi:hypothetical protein
VKRQKTRYVPPYRYTAEELNACALADLEIDLAHAEAHTEREDMAAYAAELRVEIARLRGEVPQ